MADPARRRVWLRGLLLGLPLVGLVVALAVQGAMLSEQGRRLSALEEQVRSLRRLELQAADAMIGRRGPSRTLGEAGRDLAEYRRGIAEARSAGPPSR